MRGWLAARGAELGAALGLLTRLPLGAWPMPADNAGFARAAWAYPLVGALLGGLAGGVQALLVALGLPPALAAPWALATLLLASGALHEDGLADMADGFGGGRDRARKLAIMRDSRIGSFGTLALLLSLGLRGAALALLPASSLGPLLALAAAGALSRAALLLPLGLLPPAREDGLAAGISRAGVSAGVVAGLALGAALAFLLLPLPVALVAIGLAGLAGAGVAALARRQVGGQTGDVLGGCAVLAECAVLSGIVALS